MESNNGDLQLFNRAKDFPECWLTEPLCTVLMCQLTENTSLLINSLTEESDIERACRKALPLQKKPGKCGGEKKKKHTYYMGLRKCDQEINFRNGQRN